MNDSNACRRCSECVGMNHHWTPGPLAPDDPEWQPGDYACKHCEQRGDGCPECEEDGCETEGVMSSDPCGKCGGEGVIPLTDEEYAHAMQLPVEARP